MNAWVRDDDDDDNDDNDTNGVALLEMEAGAVWCGVVCLV
jgi:hypothetical protein